MFDPENGGGRRRRVKKISRLPLLQQEDHPESVSKISTYPTADTLAKEPEQTGGRPFRVCETLYAEDSSATVLERLDDCRHPDLNSIDPTTLAQLVNSGSHPLLIIDSRFEYEFEGGHIRGALNLNTPETLEAFFFGDKHKIEQLMRTKTAIVFHCEFSQQRGPRMYRTLREIDRRLHIDFYPQLFYSEVYLLEGGYKEFWGKHPELCEGGYRPMAAKEWKDDCKSEYQKNKKLHKQFSTKEACERM